MLIDHDGGIAGNITGNFLLSFLIDEAAKTTHIDVVTVSHVGFYNIEEGLYGSSDIGFVNSGFLCDLINNVCFRHGAGVLWLGFRVGKISLCGQI